MDDSERLDPATRTDQTEPGSTPPSYAPPGYATAGYPPPGYATAGYPPGSSSAGFPPPPAYESYQAPAPRPRRRGWIVALVVLAVFFLGGIGLCVWAGTQFEGDAGLVLDGDAIALIRLDGVISGTSGAVTGGGDVTPEDILGQLKQAEDDDNVKAILLRVDSPGGTVAASEEIAAEVAACSKPVVISVGDIGASGAYMVSSQADWIVCSPGSSVGSIGVILEVANLQGLLDKLGVEFAVITAGEYKDVGSPYRSMTATETEMLQEQVDTIYDQFIDIVAKGRKLPKDKVRELATGMAWVGTDAKDLGLVDQIGTYNDAIDKAARLGKIEGEPQIVEYGGDATTELLQALLGLSAKFDTLAKALKGAGVSAAQPIAR